jgi:hypothetical protein
LNSRPFLRRRHVCNYLTYSCLLVHLFLCPTVL